MRTENFPLEIIIENCVNPSNSNWERSWVEFLDRYKQLLYYFIKRCCESWNSQRLNIQFKDVINDIFSEVVITIYKNLNSYNNRDSETKFISWLQIICSRSTTAFIKRKLKNVLNEEELTEFESFKNNQTNTKLWELYENIISLLKSQLSANKNMERDINIFMLKVWSGFSTKQILEHPHYLKLNESHINVIVNRVRQNLIKEEV